jgi:hypothetical protein
MNPINPTNSSNFPITPETFWAKLSKSLRESWSPEVDAVWFTDKKKRTEFMKNAIERLDSEFSCHCDNEYWPRVDISFFDRIGPEWSVWAREAVIEVENADSWRDEVCKLMEINAGIKVLVAYVEGTEPLASFWNDLPKIYKSRKYLTQPCNWLFVFGIYGGGNGWDFKAFKFDGEIQVEITGKDRTRPFVV